MRASPSPPRHAAPESAATPCARVAPFVALVLALGSACAGAPTDRGSVSPATANGTQPAWRVRQVTLGAYHTCALLESGRVACWGDNQQGQLGNGSERPSAVPAWVPGLEGVVEVRSSDAATCARQHTGSVVCWGGNAHGEAGPPASPPNARAASAGAVDRTGEPPSYAPGNVQRAPVPIPALSGTRALAMGSRHACALDAAGHVTCWGDAAFGQLGPGPLDAFQRSSLSGLPVFVDLAAAGEDTCGRTASGDVWCWGATTSPSPRQAFTGATRLQVFTGRACAWNSAGDVSCWGSAGTCADSSPPSPPSPVADYHGSLALAHAAGGCSWCTLHASHELSCTAAPRESAHVALSEVSSVSSGNDHTCAIRRDASVWCWGGNVRGELGRPTPALRDPNPGPVQWAP